MKYPFLVKKIEEKGIKLNKIAEHLKITPKALRSKMKGKTKFTWEQVCEIQEYFFPDCSKDDLFAWDLSGEIELETETAKEKVTADEKEITSICNIETY